MNRVSRTCEIMPKGLTYMSLEYQKEKRKRLWQKKIFEEIMTKNFPNLVEEFSLQIQEAQETRQDTIKENYAYTCHIQINKHKR